MKLSKLLLIIAITSTTLFSQAQKAEKILRKSYQKSQSVDSGYFKMDKYFKSGGREDTFLTNAEYYFKRLRNDSTSAFYLNQYRSQVINETIIYNGNELIKSNLDDSTGYIMTKDKWARGIKSLSREYMVDEPFLANDNNIYPHDTDYNNANVKLEYLGEEVANNYKCYKVRMHKYFKYDSSHMSNTLRYESTYWINKKDYILVQYTNATDFIFQNDTMYQFKKNELKSYQLNVDVSSRINANALPKYIKLVEYTKDYYKPPKPLPLDTIAPSWTLTSLNGELYSLDSLKGKIVVIDFFYRACAPCMMAIPKLQSIHEKYKGNEVVIIGVDPFDEDTDGFRKFLEVKGVTYPVLLGAKDAANDYRVRAYPRIFIIGKDGKIIYVHEGYTDDMEEEITKVIDENL